MTKSPMIRPRLRRLLMTAGASTMIALAPGGAMAASGHTKPSDPLNAPTFQQQTAHWTSAQLAAYQAKLQLVSGSRKARPSGAMTASTPDYCFYGCFPNSHYSYMAVVYEGSNDCACGPATATEMYSTYTHYFSQPSPGLSLSQVETEMQNNGWYSCSVGTYRYGLANEMNLHQSQNSYVWQAVNSGSDVYGYTEVDIAYNFPVGYDGETYGPDGYPLDNYQGVDWKHYFPAYGYDASYNVYVADPHYAYDHSYSSNAVYLFIDNFPYTNQVLW